MRAERESGERKVCLDRKGEYRNIYGKSFVTGVAEGVMLFIYIFIYNTQLASRNCLS